jgi:hypothetical protein
MNAFAIIWTSGTEKIVPVTSVYIMRAVHKEERENALL